MLLIIFMNIFILPNRQHTTLHNTKSSHKAYKSTTTHTQNNRKSKTNKNALSVNLKQRVSAHESFLGTSSVSLYTTIQYHANQDYFLYPE